MKRFLTLLLCCAVVAATACACGGTIEEPKTTEEETTVGAIVETFQIDKTPMTHTDTLSFSWFAPRIKGARLLDYLTPQLPEIFDVMGYEHEGQFVIGEGVAKLMPNRFRAPTMRCYSVENRSIYAGILLLCCGMHRDDDSMLVCVQVINESISPGALSQPYGNDFWFADFDGDGAEEVFAVSYNGYADRSAAYVGVFPFTEEGYGEPLFWSYTEKEPMPYDFGFELLDTKNPYIIKNSRTDYVREFESASMDIYHWAVDDAEIYDGVAVDVDEDGVYELIVTQSPFKCDGLLFSLLRYNVKEKSFQTEYAAYLKVDEFDWETNADMYGPFLKQAGYDVKNVTFLN